LSLLQDILKRLFSGVFIILAADAEAIASASSDKAYVGLDLKP